MSLNRLIAPAALVSSLLLFSACGSQKTENDQVTPSASDAAAARLAHVAAAQMDPSRNIVENASTSGDHTTLVAAVKAAGLVDTLSGAGPFTLFAPTNVAFDKLPAGALDSLLTPRNRPALVRALSYHVVPGRITAADLAGRIKAGKGRAFLKTVEGANLSAYEGAGGIILTDSAGGFSAITTPDLMQSNGVIHVIDAVLTPPS
jgi:uncharacterized surface protein with fasciclin (FAS1) repeats